MRRGSWKIRIFIGLAIVAFAFFKRCNSKEKNEYTGRVQTINMTADQEIAKGLNDLARSIRSSMAFNQNNPR